MYTNGSPTSVVTAEAASVVPSVPRPRIGAKSSVRPKLSRASGTPTMSDAQISVQKVWRARTTDSRRLTGRPADCPASRAVAINWLSTASAMKPIAATIAARAIRRIEHGILLARWSDRLDAFEQLADLGQPDEGEDHQDHERAEEAHHLGADVDRRRSQARGRLQRQVERPGRRRRGRQAADRAAAGPPAGDRATAAPAARRCPRRPRRSRRCRYRQRRGAFQELTEPRDLDIAARQQDAHPLARADRQASRQDRRERGAPRPAREPASSARPRTEARQDGRVVEEDDLVDVALDHRQRPCRRRTARRARRRRCGLQRAPARRPRGRESWRSDRSARRRRP